MSDRPVYSTSTGSQKKQQNKKTASYVKADGPSKMRLETKGRGGKAVTVIFNMPFEETEAKTLMKEIQSNLGIGATFKNSSIELRGDVRNKVEEIFAKKGLKMIRAGG